MAPVATAEAVESPAQRGARHRGGAFRPASTGLPSQRLQLSLTPLMWTILYENVAWGFVALRISAGSCGLASFVPAIVTSHGTALPRGFATHQNPLSRAAPGASNRRRGLRPRQCCGTRARSVGANAAQRASTGGAADYPWI